MKPWLVFAAALFSCRPASDGASHPPARNVQRLERDCAAGDGAACTDLGARYQRGSEVAQDLARAVGYYERACAGGHAAGCHQAGQAHLIGAGVPRDAERAIPLLDKACEGNDAHGCFKLGAVHAGGAFGPKRDDRVGLTFLSKACGLGLAEGCFRAGTMLESDTSDRAANRELACTRFASGCGYRQGQELPKDLTSVGQASSCWRLGLACDKVPNGPAGGDAKKLVGDSIAYFEGRCAAGEAMACYVLGDLYATGEGVEQSAERSREMFARACELNSPAACERAQ